MREPMELQLAKLINAREPDGTLRYPRRERLAMVGLIYLASRDTGFRPGAQAYELLGELLLELSDHPAPTLVGSLASFLAATPMESELPRAVQELLREALTERRARGAPALPDVAGRFRELLDALPRRGLGFEPTSADEDA